MSLGNENKLLNSYSAFGAQTILALENAKIFEEVVFSISKRLAIAASSGTPLDITIDPTKCICDKIVVLPIQFKAAGAGPIHIDLYVNPTFTENGDLLVPVNRDFTSTKISLLEWRVGPTVSAPGTISPSEFIILSNGTSAVATAGGESREDLVINVDLTKKYLFRLTNQENVAARGSLTSSWFELPIV